MTEHSVDAVGRPLLQRGTAALGLKGDPRAGQDAAQRLLIPSSHSAMAATPSRKKISVRSVGDVADVRRGEHVGHRAQRMAGGQRFGVEDVERGARDRARPQRLDQRGLVDDRPARRIDQQRSRFHRRESRRPDQAAGSLAQLEVDGQRRRRWRRTRRAAGTGRRPPRRRPRSGSGSTPPRPCRTPRRCAPSARRSGRGRARRARGGRVRARRWSATRRRRSTAVRRRGGVPRPGSAPRSAPPSRRRCRRWCRRGCPVSAAAAMSIDALAGPVDAIIRSRGSRSMTLRGNGVRSRITKTTSNGVESRDQFVGVGDVVGEDGDVGPRGDGRPVRQASARRSGSRRGRPPEPVRSSPRLSVSTTPTGAHPLASDGGHSAGTDMVARCRS